MRAALLIIAVALGGCMTARLPEPVRADSECHSERYEEGESFPAPSAPLDELFRRPRIAHYPRSADEPARIVTVRRQGPYSDPEAQVSLIETAGGELRAELFEPEGCSVSDQLRSAFLSDRGSTEGERLKRVRIRRTVVTEGDVPELRRLNREFARLRISAALFEGLALDTRVYDLWVETPLESLEMSTIRPDRRFASWAERLIAAVRRPRD